MVYPGYKETHGLTVEIVPLMSLFVQHQNRLMLTRLPATPRPSDAVIVIEAKMDACMYK